jgi:NAD(P)-dependent dehydrogenase (short-subunit alcohol dehydrogenase family)
MKRLKNKVAFITGASLGIGKATAELFAKEGARVAITDILNAEGAALANKINSEGGVAEFWHLDVSIEVAVEKVMNDVFNKWGSIDILVNNAGIAGVDVPTHEVTEKQWDKVMSINVKGVFFCTKYAVNYMKINSGGSIINLSSIYGIVGAPNVPPYHASKGAVREMSKTDALIYAKDKIRVNSIHPGFIWTPMVENFLKESAPSIEEGKENLIALHPIGRLGEPNDIAYGILYLASEESSFVTGTELLIDGGYTAQ